MSKIVVLKTEEGFEGWWKDTILRRADLDVLPTKDYETAFQRIMENDPELFIVEEWSDHVRLQLFIRRVRASYTVGRLKGLVITPIENPDLNKPPVSKVLLLPLTVSELNGTVAKLLNLPRRGARRYLVRMMVNAKPEVNQAGESAVTINLSSSGMLVQTNKPLTIGKRLYWSFTGVDELKGVLIPGTVLRGTADKVLPNIQCYAIKFDEDAKLEMEYLEKYLSDNY
jgi:hypothetical protein